MLVGLLLALGAAVTTGVASVLQAIAARRAHHDAGQAVGGHGAVGRLVVSPLYLSGSGLDLLGFLCIVGALHWFPLFLVQCAAASSVGVTALVGRRLLGTTLSHRDLFALLGLGAGLVLLASGAQAEAATAVGRTPQWWLVVAAGPVIVVGVLLARLTSPRAGGILAALAGLSFAGTGIAARMLSNAHSVTTVVDAPATYALIGLGVAGMALFAAALQRSPVTTATAALFGVETLTASTVGLLVLGDSTRHGFAAPTAIGFAITLGCALALALSASDGQQKARGASRPATFFGVEA